ncbi:transposase [Streptomyces sp. NPDC005728]|uniref:transposase n=1 Tax=Streptomyces sp. NPDC005728 TaxID=3157054 RepID=UPI0034043486
MRYAKGGGKTDERPAFREQLRLEAAERFMQSDENTVIAHDLRVSVRSVQRWRKAWAQGGPGALASKGPASLPLLSDGLFAALERELAKGPVVHGGPDQTWTLSRIMTLIGHRFHKSYTVQGVAAHLTAGMRRYIADRDWLAVFPLPPYAPDLNPVEGIWSVLRRITVANRAFADSDDLITAVRRGLRQLQYRHDVLDGCLTGTGLRRRSP